MTVTPNPSVDRTLHVPVLVRGAVLRATGAVVQASGKGVNVARALAAQGHAARAVAPIGGHEGAQLAELAARDGVELLAVPVARPVRANVSVVEPGGVVTKLNEPGPTLDASAWDALLAAVTDAAAGCDWIVGCGSLPPGAPADLHARLVPIARAAGARVAVDSSGPSLLRAIEAGVDLAKPNAGELAEAVGRASATLGDALAGAQALRAAGARAILLSLGPDGALLVDEDGALHGEAPVAAPASTVGAGDALLAGFLAAGGSGKAALAEGLAWAAAACRLADSAVPQPDDLDWDGVALHAQVDAARRLRTDGAGAAA